MEPGPEAAPPPDGRSLPVRLCRIDDPEIRPVYVQMAVENGMNPGRPFDMAVKDYYHTANDLLWKKHMGDRQKPKDWHMDFYSWYAQKRRRRK